MRSCSSRAKRKGRRIVLSLHDEHIEVLDHLARRQGSRSGAVQRLLEEVKPREIYRKLDEAYTAKTSHRTA